MKLTNSNSDFELKNSNSQLSDIKHLDFLINPTTCKLVFLQSVIESIFLLERHLMSEEDRQ